MMMMTKKKEKRTVLIYDEGYAENDETFPRCIVVILFMSTESRNLGQSLTLKTRIKLLFCFDILEEYSSKAFIHQNLPHSCRRCGLVVQSACLVNRRSWVRIPAAPLQLCVLTVTQHHTPTGSHLFLVSRSPVDGFSKPRLFPAPESLSQDE